MTSPVDRLRAGLGALPTDRPHRILVALSGGADSVTLLHLLRFGLPAGDRGRIEVHAAHLDHAMRAESAADADWVRGVCRAWRVPLTVRRLDAPPSSESEAREARLSFLEEVADELDADAILTAHHRDDQAETVLFRAARGSGLAGLAGIPRVRGRWRRPLLDVRRDELRDWAARHGVRWREDATNRGGGNARSRMRARVLPALESEVAPGAVEALARLADHAREASEETVALTDALAAALGARVEADRVSLPVEGLAGLDPRARRLLLRWAATRLGPPLDLATTERLEEASPGLGVGRRLDVIGGLELHRTHDHLLVVRPPRDREDWAPVRVEGAHPGGAAVLRLGRRRLRLLWGPEAPADRERCVARTHLPLESITFPLTARGWEPGDRIRLEGGSRSVAKLLSEARVPVPDRPTTPVLLDAEGAVLWIPDLDRRDAGLDDATDSFWMGITDDGD